MPNKENIIGKGFDKNPQNINKQGRKPKLINHVIRELEKNGIKATTKTEVKDVYLRLINLSVEDLQKISKDKKQPVLIYIVSKHILSGRGYDIIEKILDRTIGKPEQNIDHTTGGKSMIEPQKVKISIDSKDIVLR